MSSSEEKNNELAFEEGVAIKCPHCGEVIYKEEFDND